MEECPYCGAIYNPDAQWHYGYYKGGTTGEFNVLGKIPDGVCPVCRKAPTEERGGG